MRIPRATLERIRTEATSAARRWIAGDRATALAEIGRIADDPRLFSPGADHLSPQAATHLGHAVAERLTADDPEGDQTLALAGLLVAANHPGLRMVGPHVLTPRAARQAEWAARIVGLARTCRDGFAVAALVIPLTGAAMRDAAALAAAIADLERGRLGEAERALVGTLEHTLAARSPDTARRFSAALAAAGWSGARGRGTP